MTEMKDLFEKAIQNIAQNHRKIIDDWCKAYLAQLYEEGVQIKPGCFTLNEQVPTFHKAQDCMVKRYWFEVGKPNYNDCDGWIKCSDALPTHKIPVYFTYCDDGEIHKDIWYDYYEKDWMKEGPRGSYGSYRGKVTHWMPLPDAPKDNK